MFACQFPGGFNENDNDGPEIWRMDQDRNLCQVTVNEKLHKGREGEDQRLLRVECSSVKLIPINESIDKRKKRAIDETQLGPQFKKKFKNQKTM